MATRTGATACWCVFRDGIEPEDRGAPPASRVAQAGQFVRVRMAGKPYEQQEDATVVIEQPWWGVAPNDVLVSHLEGHDPELATRRSGPVRVLRATRPRSP